MTGTISVDAHAQGTFDKLAGSGTIALTNGVAYGEPYDAVNVALSVQGQDYEASQVSVKLHGMTIAGNGGYDLASKHIHAHVEGNNLQLSKFTTVQNQNINADGLINILADANGTLEEPGLKASVKVANLVVQGKSIGEATIDAHSGGSLVSYTMRSNLIGTQVAAEGQTDLKGDYETKAKLTIADLDVRVLWRCFSQGASRLARTSRGSLR